MIMLKPKTLLLAVIAAAGFFCACDSESIEGDAEYFRRGAFEETVDGTRMVFVQTGEANEVLFTWDRINKNYLINEFATISTRTYTYSGDITVPATVQHDGVTYTVTGIDDYVFMLNTKLTSIVVSEGIRTWGKDELVGSIANLTKVYLPSTLENVTDIPYGMFAKCSKMTSVHLPNVTAIGDSAFASCLKLTDINIPEGCVSLGRFAFARNTALEQLTLPSSLQTIGENCFGACNKLKTLHVRATTPPVLETNLPKATEATLYVPTGCYDIYAADKEWGQFMEIIEED